MIGTFLKSLRRGHVAFSVLALQLIAVQAQGRAPSEWLRVAALPGVRIAVEQGAKGPENVRLRVGQQERVFRVQELPAGTSLYHWGDREVLAAWDRAGAVGAAALNERMAGGAALGGLYTSMHPWDSVIYGSAQLEVTLRAPVRLLVAAEAPLEPGSDPLTELTGQVAAGSPLAWSELLHTAGISGVYIGSVPAYSDTPGFQWVVLDDAAALQQVRLASAEGLLLHMRAGGWRQAAEGALSLPLLQFLAVARLQEHGLPEARVRAALPAELAWLSQAVDAPRVPSATQRAALWEAVPNTPTAWQAWGFSKQRALCSLSQGDGLVDMRAASLCTQFIERMCAEEDLAD